MEKISLTALARQHLESARAASSGRSAHTVYGGHEHSLRQTLMAMTAGSTMDDHESPGEATLQVLHGRVRVTNSTTGWDGSPAITSSCREPGTVCTRSKTRWCY